MANKYLDYEGLKILVDWIKDRGVTIEEIDSLTNEGEIEPVDGHVYIYDNNLYKYSSTEGFINLSETRFLQDLIATVDVGVHSIDSSGSVTLELAGKTLDEAFQYLYCEEDTNVQKTAPTATLTLNNSGTHEVGTTIAPQYKIVFGAGAYAYGPATGITATHVISNDSDSSESYTVESSAAGTQTGNFATITIGDSTAFTISSVTNYTAGATPVSNLGNELPDKAFAAGTITNKNKGTLKGYRQIFYGAIEHTNDEWSSDEIRALGKSGNPSKGTVKITTTSTTKRLVVAIPQSLGYVVSEAYNTTALNAKETFEKIGTAEVEGANGYTAATYDIWACTNATFYADDVIEITIA